MKKWMLSAVAATVMAASVTAGSARADDAGGIVDQVALDAMWRGGPVLVVDGTFTFGVPERPAEGEPLAYKLPFAFRDGRPLELCALKGTLEARVFLDDLWVGLGPIGPGTPPGPCILVSGSRVMVVNVSQSGPVLGRATPK